MKNEEVFLRIATLSDAKILYEWINDEEVRKNAFDTHIITIEEHLAWFNRLLNDKNQAQYILMRGDKPIGQLRLNIECSEAEIDYSISNEERGYGYGKAIIGLSIKKVKEDFPRVNKLIGKVKPSNAASFLCFKKNGFDEKYQQLEFDLSAGCDNHKISVPESGG